jgi:hypothetical protein
MKKPSPTKCLRSPVTFDNITFGEGGVGPDGERFISIIITVQKKINETLIRYDEITSASSPEISKLNRCGAHLISQAARSVFLRKLQELGPQEPSFKVATRVGPFEECFVLPDQVVSVTGKKVPVAFDDNLRNYLAWGRTGGTLEGWREFENLAVGNSRLILALGSPGSVATVQYSLNRSTSDRVWRAPKAKGAWWTERIAARWKRRSRKAIF